MKKKKYLLLLLLAALLLAGCGAQSDRPTEPEPTPAAVETPAELHFGTLTVSPDVERLDLAGTGATLEELMSASNVLSNIKEISLGVTKANLAQLRAVAAAYPQAEVSWKAVVLGEEIDSSAPPPARRRRARRDC